MLNRCAALIVSETMACIIDCTDSFVVISFYSSTIFLNAGYTPTQALYASLGYGAIQVVSTIPTLFLIDTKGRRTLTLLVSCPDSHL